MKVKTKLTESLVEFGAPPPYKEGDKSRMFVGPVRRDGKYPVTYVFPGSGKKISTVISAEKLEQDKKKYDVFQGSGR